MVSISGPPGAAVTPTPGAVRAVDGSGVVVASVETNTNGSFQLALANGTYRLAGRSPLYQSAEADCTTKADISVKDRFLDNVTVECTRR